MMKTIIQFLLILSIQFYCIVLTGQNVGIQTETPQAPLHIVGNMEALRIQGGSSYISFFDEADVYKGFLWQGPGNNVSIGTAQNSLGRVEVYNSLNLNMAIDKTGIVDIFGTQPSLNLRDGTSKLYGELYRNGNNFEIAGYRATGFGTPGNIILATSVIGGPFELTKLAGNVGIGTRTPATKLHVAADNEAFRLEGTGYTFMSFYNGAAYKGFLLSDQNNIGLGTSAANTTGSVWIYANNAIRMLVHPNGNVGIGTLNPTHKLSVNGTVRTKEVIVDSGWADYVFRDDYNLSNLLEVEKFIQENNHLPGIPSALEIEKEGLSMGDMQRRMMEKIEELTLYVISLQKEISALKNDPALPKNQ